MSRRHAFEFTGFLQVAHALLGETKLQPILQGEHMLAFHRVALALSAAALIGTPQIAAAAALTVGGEQALIAAQQASPGFVKQDGEANVAMQSAQEKPAVDVKARVGSRARADIAWAPNQERDSRSLAEARARVLERTPSTVLR